MPPSPAPGSLTTAFPPPSPDADATAYDAIAPAGWEQTIQRMKKSGKVSNPWALAWWMKRKHYKPHRSAGADAEALFSAQVALAERLMHLELAAQVGDAAPGALVRWVVQGLVESGETTSRTALLYAEKPGGFQCRSCRYAQARNATHARCTLLDGSVHLDNGCCVGWEADLTQLQTHREFS